MPAKTPKQYRYAGPAAGRGEAWAKRMVKHTSPAKRQRWAKKGKR